jgi:hypothetical protein
MKQPFSPEDIIILRRSFFSVAQKNGCSSVYVALIAKGKRNINTPIAKAVMKDLKKLLTLLKPNTNG